MVESAAASLRHDFMHGSDALIDRRRGIVGLSIFSTCILGVVALYQTGILKRLPPHSRLFDPEAVHGSRLGFSMGVTAPDAVLGMASYATTASLAAIGDAEQWRTGRTLPIATAAKCIVDAALSSRLAVEQWKRFRTFSPWSLLVFAATCGSLIFATREVLDVFDTKLSRS
jgi:hypothetical protein